mmetsp:Transcript_24515/g.40183  ORF Transcript_24515/g.40183 Transcript_24515/m.40183 type:complete len:116 (-) Transcript_24515:78-425(-)
MIFAFIPATISTLISNTNEKHTFLKYSPYRTVRTSFRFPGMLFQQQVQLLLLVNSHSIVASLEDKWHLATRLDCLTLRKRPMGFVKSTAYGTFYFGRRNGRFYDSRFPPFHYIKK